MHTGNSHFNVSIVLHVSIFAILDHGQYCLIEQFCHLRQKSHMTSALTSPSDNLLSLPIK